MNKQSKSQFIFFVIHHEHQNFLVSQYSFIFILIKLKNKPTLIKIKYFFEQIMKGAIYELSLFLHEIIIYNYIIILEQQQIRMQNSSSKIKEAFKQAELSLGLNKQFYDAKFVYQQQQTSNSDAFLLSVFKELPSQIHGFSQEQIQLIHAFAGQIMQEAAKSLQVPICTLILAKSIFHFFYTRKSFLQYDIRDIMMGAMYLACKSEQTLRKSYQIAMVFDFIFKAYEGDRNMAPLEVGSIEYEHIKNLTILKSQLDILFQLGFDVYRLFNLPHRYIGNFLTLFDKNSKYATICNLTWKNLNDCYQTTICLYYPSQMIAAAAVYMSMRQCNANFPEIPWWTLMQSYQEGIQNIQILVRTAQRQKDKINFQDIARKITEIGESQDIQNAFPVPYYRKIMLERRGKLRISKNIVNHSNSFNNSQQQMKQVNNNLQNKNITQIFQNKKQQKQNQKIDNVINIEEQFKQRKFTIDKKNLLANISQKLRKHQAIINNVQNNKAKQKQLSNSQESSEDQELIAELRKKVQRNKEAQREEQNK